MLTRIRHRSSSLKVDLHSVNIILSPVCSCGPPIKEAEHCFFECPLYTNQRNNLFIKINDADAAVLTAGSHEENKNRSIIHFAIKLTDRQTDRQTDKSFILLGHLHDI